MHIIAIAVLLVVLYPISAAAQTCYGRADLTSERPIQVGAEAYHSKIVTGKGGSFVGGNSSIFGKVGVRHENYHGVTAANTTVLDLSGGFQFAADDDRRVVMCPEIGFARFFSSENNTGTSGSSLGTSSKVIGGGASAGFVLLTGKVQIVPTAGVWFQRYWPDANTVFVGNRTQGSVRFGAGIVLSQRISIVPSGGFPFRESDGEPYVAIGLNVSIGE
jgi:hypothetical protein